MPYHSAEKRPTTTIRSFLFPILKSEAVAKITALLPNQLIHLQPFLIREKMIEKYLRKKKAHNKSS